MNIKTYLSKTNTIVYNSTINTGNNPVAELYYGDGFTRILIKFDVDKIQSLVDDKTFADTTKLKHILKIKNCWGLQAGENKIVFNSGKNTLKERTSSFDIDLIRMPEAWDGGTGSDFTMDGFLTNNASISYNGSNWFNSATETPWGEGDGAISATTFTNIVTTQHFDYGNEDIEMDITDEVNNILSGNTVNNGYMLKFPDLLENTNTIDTIGNVNYVGFFVSSTLTFFKPYFETTTSEVIKDDRADFYLDKLNRLYFYAKIGNELKNLDQNPTCTIDGVLHTVTQASKGVYYVELTLNSTDYSEKMMLYDNWSNITYNNKEFPDVELDFVTKISTDYFNFGNGKTPGCENKQYTPTVYGIKQNERIVRSRNQTRKVGVLARVQYTTNESANIENMEYYLYVKESDKLLDVDNGLVEKTFDGNYFILDIDSLLPNQYYLDIKIKNDQEYINHREVLKFEIVNEL